MRGPSCGAFVVAAALLVGGCQAGDASHELVVTTAEGDTTYVVDAGDIPRDGLVAAGCVLLGAPVSDLVDGWELVSPGSVVADGVLESFTVDGERFGAHECARYLEENPQSGG
ncbi:hypothetical protein [Sediminihabitans luteus]|uniref:hypothetical protein n=1 Tax=Sediminihabitans luteus TaxID=1138585 RepID=UPI0012FE3F2F|nr:hypothetical protein [Sediminihabitans luteus]